MSFPGFPREAFDFLQGLEANNDRAWFQANKGLYERAIKWPAQAYVGEVEDGLAELLGAPVKAKIFRIHRDIRFSKDKRPYNTYLHIAFWEQSGAVRSGFYMGLEPRKLVVGGGAFDLPGPLLVAYREAVADPKTGAALQALVDERLREGWRLHEPALKRVPSGYAADHPRGELLKHKGLAMFRDVEDLGVASSPAVVSETLAAFDRYRPVHEWLGELRAKA